MLGNSFGGELTSSDTSERCDEQKPPSRRLPVQEHGDLRGQRHYNPRRNQGVRGRESRQEVDQ